MKKDVNFENHYLSEDGKIIVPKIRENDDYGTTSIWLGRLDSIDNYEEIDEPQGEEYVVQ